MSALRVVIVTSNASGNAARVCHHLARSVQGIVIAGAIVDAGTAADRRRQVRRLKAWRRQGGIRYMLWRCWLEVHGKIDPPPRASYAYSLDQLGDMFDFPVIRVPNVNSDEARDGLRRLDAELGISVGNRVMQESTFSAPSLGMVNLHHGRIPEYRGGPPAFWEIYHHERSMAVSVHRVDAQLDHGELLGAAEVPLFEGDDAQAAMERIYGVDVQLVGDVVAAIADDTASPIAVDFANGRVRTLPSRAQIRSLEGRLGRPVRHDDFRKAALPPLPDASP